MCRMLLQRNSPFTFDIEVCVFGSSYPLEKSVARVSCKIWERKIHATLLPHADCYTTAFEPIVMANTHNYVQN